MEREEKLDRILPPNERRCPNCGDDLRKYVATERELAEAAQHCLLLRAAIPPKIMPHIKISEKLGSELLSDAIHELLMCRLGTEQAAKAITSIKACMEKYRELEALYKAAVEENQQLKDGEAGSGKRAEVQ